MYAIFAMSMHSLNPRLCAVVAVGGPSQIATDDDCHGVLTSCVTVSVTAGASYAIQVDGYNGNWGAVSLLVTAA